MTAASMRYNGVGDGVGIVTCIVTMCMLKGVVNHT